MCKHESLYINISCVTQLPSHTIHCIQRLSIAQTSMKGKQLSADIVTILSGQSRHRSIIRLWAWWLYCWHTHKLTYWQTSKLFKIMPYEVWGYGLRLWNLSKNFYTKLLTRYICRLFFIISPSSICLNILPKTIQMLVEMCMDIQ